MIHIIKTYFLSFQSIKINDKKVILKFFSILQIYFVLYTLIWFI